MSVVPYNKRGREVDVYDGGGQVAYPNPKRQVIIYPQRQVAAPSNQGLEAKIVSEGWKGLGFLHSKLWGIQKGAFNLVKDFGFDRRDQILSHLGLKHQKREKRSRNTTDESVGGKVVDGRPDVKRQKETGAGQSLSHTISRPAEQPAAPIFYTMGRSYGGRSRRSYRKSGRTSRRAPKRMRGYWRHAGLWRSSTAAIQNEKKYHDGTQVQFGIATAGNIPIPTLLEIPQGTSVNDRIGKTVHIKDIFLRYKLGIAQTSANQGSDIVRVMMVKDMQANGAVPVVTDVLESANYDSFNKLENKFRFKVLYDETHSLNAPGGDGTNTVRMRLQCRTNQDLKGMAMEYSGTTGAIGEIRSNNVFLLVIAEAGNATFQCRWRARYYG